VLGIRFLRVFLKRGRSVCFIQIAQTVISSADLMVVDLMSRWSEVGRYGAPHRMITAILTFGMIFQQVTFPTLARSWRQTAAAGRDALNVMVKVLMLGLIPIAVGGAVLSGPLIRLMLTKEYAGAGILLALGIWRAPLLTLAYLYQTTLIAVNREGAGVRLLLSGAAASAPLVAISCWCFGLPGAAAAVLVIGLSLVVAGYLLLASEGREPEWHHHLGRPLAAALAMVPVCLFLARWHVLVGVAGGALAYLATIWAIGGLRPDDLRAILSRGEARTTPRPHCGFGAPKCPEPVSET
jgi:O-antigen/teichoic acid export membrane protein